MKTPFKPPFKRKASGVALADLIGAAINPLLAKQGFGESSLIMDWPDIVGERLASRTEPLRLQWPTRAPNRSPDAPPEPATLIMRVEGAFAIEVQHLSAVIIDRVNAHLGWRCVGRLAIRQAPLEGRPDRDKRPKIDPVREALAGKQAESVTQSVADPDLRAALTRLGTKVLAQDHKKSPA